MTAPRTAELAVAGEISVDVSVTAVELNAPFPIGDGTGLSAAELQRAAGNMAMQRLLRGDTALPFPVADAQPAESQTGTEPRETATDLTRTPTETPGAEVDPAALGEPARLEMAMPAERDGTAAVSVEPGPPPVGIMDSTDMAASRETGAPVPTIGAASSVEDWQSQTAGAVASIPPAPFSDYSPARAALRARGFAAASSRRSSRAAERGQPRSAGARVREPREPREPDPVRPETRILDAKSNRRLDPQTPPPLQPSPRGNIPRFDARPVSGERFHILITPTSPSLMREYIEGLSEAERLELEETRQSLLQRPTEPAPATGVPAPQIVDPGPPSLSPLPADMRTDLERAFAQLLAQGPDTAKAVLDAIRLESYGGPLLQERYPQLGEAAHLAPLQERVDVRLRAIATQAGITTEQLNARIQERLAELTRRREEAAAALHQSGIEAQCRIQEEGQGDLNRIEGERQSADRTAARAGRAAARVRPSMEPAARRDRLVAETIRLVARQVTGYASQGERRDQELEARKGAYDRAYRFAAQQDEMQLETTPPADTSPQAVDDLAAASREWARVQTEAAHAAIDELKATARSQVELYQREVREAGDARLEAIRVWAENETGVRRTDAERDQQRLTDLAERDREEAEARAAIANHQTAIEIAGDLAMVRQAERDIAGGMDRETAIATHRLRGARAAVADALLDPNIPSEERGTSALAAAVRARMVNENKAEISPQLQHLLVTEHAADHENLQEIAAEVHPGFDAEDVADQVHEAVAGLGTEEEDIWRALANKDAVQVAAIKAFYLLNYEETMEEALRSDLSGREEERAMALLDSNQLLADVVAMRQAMHGNWEGMDLGLTGMGTDNETLLRMMRGRTAEERRRMAELYAQTYPGSDLIVDVHDEIEQYRDERQFDALNEGNVGLAYAIELRGGLPTEEQRRDPNHPIYGDREVVVAVYERVRQEVRELGARQGWNSDQMNAEIRRRNREIEASFNAEFGADFGESAEGALRTAFDVGFPYSRGERNLLQGYAANDEASIGASLVEIEREGIYASDDAVIAAIRRQEERAREDVRSDEMPIRRLIMAHELARLRETDRPWTHEKEWAARRRLQHGVDLALEESARGRALGNTYAMRDAYARQFPGATLEEVVESATQGYGEEEALARLRQGSLSPAEQVYYAIRGSGTREDALKAALQGRTEEEIQQIAAEFRVLDGRDMFAEIRSELSGRDAFDVDLLLQGTPETIEEERERVAARVNWELTQTGFLGRSMTDREQARMHRTLDQLDRDIEEMRALEALPGRELTADEQRRLDRVMDRFDRHAHSVDLAVEEHRRSLDRMTETITTVVGIVVAIVAGSLLMFFTGGAAGVVLAAVFGSIVATATNMGLKAAILGGAYGWEDVGVDIAVGVVDAVVAALTAGIGEKLLGTLRAGGVAAGRQIATKGARGWIANRLTQGGLRFLNPEAGALARSIPTSGALREMVERGGANKMLAIMLAEGGENLIANAPSALTGSVLNDQNWEHGNPLANIALGTVQQTVTSAAMGLAFKAGTGLVGRAGDFLGPPRNLDSLVRAEWGQFRRDYPGVSYREFVAVRERARVAMEAAAREDGPAATRRTPGEEPVGRVGEVERRPLEGQEPPPPRPAADQRAFIPERTATTTEDLRAQLPPRLRDVVPVHVDPNLPAGTVRAEYVYRWGAISDIRLVAGPDVRVVDVVLHVPTIQAMRHYTGTLGRVRVLISRIRGWFSVHGIPPIGSRAWEARLELEKLPLIIESRLEALRTGQLDARAREALLADISHLSAQVDAHQRTLDFMDVSPGQGYVAAMGRTPPEVDANLRARRGDPDAPRYVAEHSPLEAEYGPGSVFQIGPSWREEGRLYRQIEVRDSEGRVAAVREEIRMLDERGREMDHWVQRGSESTQTGRIGEEASVLMSRAEAEAQMRGVVDRPLPTQVVQRGGGQGFDEVIIRFDANGARIILVEVKNYPGRYVPLADITAVNDNLMRNLRDLRTLLSSKDAARDLGLTQAQLEQARAALASRRLEVEVRVTRETGLGTAETGTVINDLADAIEGRLGRSIPVRRREIPPGFVTRARRTVRTRDRIGSSPHYYDLANGPRRPMTDASLRRAEAAVVAERHGGDIVEGPLRRGLADDLFIDRRNNQFIMVSPEIPRTATAMERVADDIIDRLRASSSRPRGSPDAPRVILDLTDLSLAQRAELQRRIAARAARERPSNITSRLLIVDARVGEMRPFTSAARTARR